MKKVIFFLLQVVLLSASPLQTRFTTASLNELYAVFGTDTDQWLCQDEREELDETSREFVQNWAQKHGLKDPVYADEDIWFEKAFIIGASTPVMRKRLDFLVTLWERGTRFDEIIWFTSERPLDPKVDERLGETDTDAAKIIWETANIPNDMKLLPVQFLSAGSTKENIQAWLSTLEDEEELDCLFISSQPYCAYHYAMISQVLPAKYDYEVAGPVGNATSATILDTVARWVKIKNSYPSIVDEEFVKEIFTLAETLAQRAVQFYENADRSPDPIGDFTKLIRLALAEATAREYPVPPIPLIFAMVQSKAEELLPEEDLKDFQYMLNQVEAEIWIR
jgi:hypothetical protein